MTIVVFILMAWPCGRIFMCIFMCILFNRNWFYVPHSCVNTCGHIFMCFGFMCILFNRSWCYVPHSCVNKCGRIFMCFGFMCILFNRSWCYVPHSCYTLYYLMCCARTAL